MWKHFHWLFLVLACVPTFLGAQAPGSVSVDLTVGGAAGSGGQFDKRGGPALDMLVGLRVGGNASGRMLLGLNAGLQGPVWVTESCCLPTFPLFYSAGAIVGWEFGRARSAAFRASAGPSYMWADEGSAFGLQGRLDIASPPFMRVAAVASVRGGLLPDFEGVGLRMWAAGVGLRIQ